MAGNLEIFVLFVRAALVVGIYYIVYTQRNEPREHIVKLRVLKISSEPIYMCVCVFYFILTYIIIYDVRKNKM